MENNPCKEIELPVGSLVKIEFQEQYMETEEFAQNQKADFEEAYPENIWLGLGGLNIKGIIWHFLDDKLKEVRRGKSGLLRGVFQLGAPEEFGTKLPVFLQVSFDNRLYTARLLISYKYLESLKLESCPPTMDDIPSSAIDKLFDEFHHYVFNKLIEDVK